MKTLIVFSHSYFDKSRVNRALLEAASEVPDVTIRNLEELYGRDPQKIDVPAEQKFLENNTRIVFQFPMFWFNLTPMLKGYMDQVFAHGWAYGTNGHALKGKQLLLAVTTGAPAENYQSPSVGELLLPVTNSGVFTEMDVQPLRVLHGCLNISEADLKKACNNYKTLLSGGEYLNS